MGPEYDHVAIEEQARLLWETHGVHRFDPTGSGPVFSIDTPPPYVSAAHLHVGHAMSYSQADFVARYRRMRGDRVFYPMGFDDNGLPTERYVEQKHGISAADMPRAEFVRLCLDETRATAATYEDLWRRLGLSVDWSLSYSTIDERCQRAAQTAFVRLHDAGLVRRRNDPILWCPECRTSLAQADLEDLERKGRIHRIAFTAVGDGRPLVVATTRPELLPACVALYAHPADDRYRGLIGGTARVPVFGHAVPIRTDESVDPGFGTGLMMVCTFGDAEDVAKWRRDGLDLRLVVEPDGRLADTAGPLAGKPVLDARGIAVTLLRDAGALGESSSLRQVVGVHERCGTPIEFQIRPQWFVAVQEHRDRFRARAAELVWIPPFMKRRLDDWIDGLRWDWNISRQRHYGVPFPVWYCRSCQGAVVAALDELPVDPSATAPPACPHCGGSDVAPELDVMDTWMTSSLTPQINTGWGPSPMSLRVQAFEIIRTWLFYSVVQSEFLLGRVPWTSVMISGWGLDEQGRKIAKRNLERSTTADGFNRYVPDQVVARYGADALRLWATGARVGHDLRYSEKDVRVGRKFAVKLWNLGRFVELNGGGAIDPVPVAERTAVDRWLLSHLAETIEQVSAAFDEFDGTAAHRIASRFFWSVLCDRYVEMIKDRFLDPERHGEGDRRSARATLGEALRAVLGLFAPFAPFVTEHLYQHFHAADEGVASLHLTRWPEPDPAWAGDRGAIEQMVTMLDAVRVLRSRERLSANTRVAVLVLDAPAGPARSLAEEIAEPLRAAARADQVVFGPAEHGSGVAGITLALVV